jgi:citrate lyase subunit beta/citryl-CoA lyase
MPSSHPDHALFDGQKPFPLLPACDHYAGTEKTMTRSLALQAAHPAAFDVTLDLEDGAPTGQEKAQAELVVELLNSPANARGRAGVRIHDHASPFWRQDVDLLVRGAGKLISHITIPKLDTARQLSGMVTYIQNTCAFSEVGREIPIHVLIETHGALFEAYKIAALPWLRCLEFGIMDFVSSHHGAISSEAMRSPLQFEHALLRRAKTIQVAAALAHGLVPAHNVTLAVRDPDLVKADARRARDEFGYLRMWSVHPSQIDPILEAFAPRTSEIEVATRVLCDAAAKSWAPIEVDGKLYDRASYRYYWQLVKRAQLNDQTLPDDLLAAFFSEGPAA